MYDYGNARIAARRSRLADAAALERLADSGSTAAALGLLERDPAWAERLRVVREEAAAPADLLELAIDRFRSDELGALPGWYEGTPRRLVEALVMDLDRERVVAILRRRRAGQDSEAINPTISPGALLSGEQLVALSREPAPDRVVRTLARLGMISASRPEAAEIAAADRPLAAVEAALSAAWHRARLARAGGSGEGSRRVRQLLADERAEREAVTLELSGGAGPAALVERSLRLVRLDRVAGAGPRDPCGIGAVAGYVAAVEAHAIRLRTVLARLAGGWSAQVARTYLGVAA